MECRGFVLTPALALVCLVASQPGQAEPGSSMASTAGAASSSSASAALTTGVVESVDDAAGIVTLRHDEIVNMRMPAMTMTFGVADKSILERVRPGEKVRFRVEMLRNVPTIVRIEAVP